MKADFRGLDLSIARARVVLSLVATLSLYVDPSAGGLFHLGGWLLLTLLCHLIYSTLTYLALSYGIGTTPIWKLSVAFDLIFATTITFLAEGRTTPSLVFFVFAIVAVGFRSGFLNTLIVTLCSVALYVSVMLLSDGLASTYTMRAVYLAIAGYLIGFFGQQRVNFEMRLRELEAAAERETIARSLHDGYIQALAGLSLRLESCRDMLVSNQPEEALGEIKEIQSEVCHEYDEAREYVRSLAGAKRQISNPASNVDSDVEFQMQASFGAQGAAIEHIMQIVLEGVRNTRRHGHAESASIKIDRAGKIVHLTIDDDGVGFDVSANPPWTIASRVAALGGRLVIRTVRQGAHLEIAIPVL